jgi:hypothetical protein
MLHILSAPAQIPYNCPILASGHWLLAAGFF